jgi:hypothetical protein
MKRDTTAERCPAPNRRLRLETVSLTDDLLFGDIWRRPELPPATAVWRSRKHASLGLMESELVRQLRQAPKFEGFTRG